MAPSSQVLSYDVPAVPGVHGASHRQVWYDDPETLATKYAAIKARGVRAVGMWTADSAGSDAEVAAAMWASVPAPGSPRAPATGAPL